MCEGRLDTTTTRGKLDFCESEKERKASTVRAKRGSGREKGRMEEGDRVRERESEREYIAYTQSPASS